MRKFLVSNMDNGVVEELIFNEEWEVINFLQTKGYSDYEILTMICYIYIK